MDYPNSLLYKVSGNGLKRASWIYGTIHMICSHDFELKSKVLNALKKCSHLYMEVDLGNEDEMLSMEVGDGHKKCCLEELTAEEKDQLNDILIQRYALDIAQLRELSPMYLINKMTLDALGCSEIKMTELELLKEAKFLGMETGGIETAKEQLEIADKVFDGKEILIQLTGAVDYKEIFPKVVDAYKKERLSVLSDLVNGGNFMSKKAFDILVTKRNREWSNKIPRIISTRPSFIAIGAGHLPGENGLINLLRQKGYRINPVYR